jgi:Ni,Fe-hydrogenase III small subunit
MRDFLRARAAQGTPTAAMPAGADALPPRFRGLPVLTGAPQTALDLGACLFSPEEAAAQSAGQLAFTRDHRLATSSRSGQAWTSGQPPLVTPLAGEMRRLFGRSLRLRSVAAGSCGGCEAELVALSNVVFDMARFGIQFVASPRHADGIVVTGAISRNMTDALRQTWEAVAEPKIVIAVGACAASGGPFAGSAEVGDGVPAELPVDLWIPGCPPHPLTILDGLLRLLGRLDERRTAGGASSLSESGAAEVMPAADAPPPLPDR